MTVSAIAGGGLCLAAVLLLVRLVRGPGALDRLAAAYGALVCGALALAFVEGTGGRWIVAALALILFTAAFVLAGVKAYRGLGFRAPLAAPDDGAAP
jgi:multisubunit Na+/H+ antiporter MnhF subunit